MTRMENGQLSQEGQLPAQPRGEHPFPIAVWLTLRPYALSLLVDWLLAVGLWGLLWLFERITALVPIGGWAGEFILAIHATGTVVAYGLFAGLLVWDIIEIRKGRV
jgi:hypothetical protein